MAKLIYSAIASAEGYVEDADGSGRAGQVQAEWSGKFLGELPLHPRDPAEEPRHCGTELPSVERPDAEVDWPARLQDVVTQVGCDIEGEHVHYRVKGIRSQVRDTRPVLNRH